MVKIHKASKDSRQPWLPCQDPSDAILAKIIKEKHQINQFQDKRKPKSQVYKVSWKKHYKVCLGMKLIEIKVIKAQSPSIHPHCASNSLAKRDWASVWVNLRAGQARSPSNQVRDPSSAFRQCNFSTGATRQWRATRWVRRMTRQRPAYQTDWKFIQGPSEIAKFPKVGSPT